MRARRTLARGSLCYASFASSGAGRRAPSPLWFSSIVSATASRSPSKRSAYTSSVIAADECPSCLWANFTLAPRRHQQPRGDVPQPVDCHPREIRVIDQRPITGPVEPRLLADQDQRPTARPFPHPRAPWAPRHERGEHVAHEGGDSHAPRLVGLQRAHLDAPVDGHGRALQPRLPPLEVKKTDLQPRQLRPPHPRRRQHPEDLRLHRAVLRQRPNLLHRQEHLHAFRPPRERDPAPDSPTDTHQPPPCPAPARGRSGRAGRWRRRCRGRRPIPGLRSA